MNDIKTIVQQFANLSDIERRLVLIELAERDLIDFPELSVLYVGRLKKERHVAAEHRAKLSLYVGMYSMSDATDHGKFVRKFLFDNQDFHGSKFGDSLNAEFLKPEETNKTE